MHACFWTTQAAKPSGFSLLIAHFGHKKRLAALVGAVSPLVLESVISFSECDWAVAHARGRSKGSQGCREDADDDLNDGLPSFLLHSAFMVFLGFITMEGALPGQSPLRLLSLLRRA